MKLQQAPKRLMVVVAWIALVSCGVLRAQYSSASFDLKKASDLYDERGFRQNKAISIDGKLVVAESNGNVSYSYPISQHTVSGYPLNVNLNYCGSVAFTTFKDYYSGPTQPEDPNSPVSSAGQRWAKFHQDRPAWILGVNGFAVQVLATTTQFHMDYNKLTDPGFDDRISFRDSDFVWVIDGYDFCNRMKRIGVEEDVGGISRTNFIDVIRLLRDDGSVLELINAKRSDTATTAMFNDSMYTGYYVSPDANNKGFALVEYAEEGMPVFLSTTSAPYTDPRVVRYYPGDGLEYVFHEVVIPYGTDEYREPLATYGGAAAGPTIFYLEEINSASGRITTFSRSRHENRLDRIGFRSANDSTKGRALVTEFDGHKITYSNSGLLIEALGRTITVKIDVISKSGNTGEETKMPLASNGDFYTNAADMAKTRRAAPRQYRSYVGYVTEILDPEGRKTQFDYEQYTKKYVGSGFPVSDPATTIWLNNWRLKEIHEPTARYDLSYYARSPHIADPTPSDTATIYDNTKDLYKLQTMLESYRKYDGDSLLTTDEYVFDVTDSTITYDLAEDLQFVSKSTHTHTDEVTGKAVTTTYRYRVHRLPKYLPYLSRPRYTEMYNLSESTNGYTSTRTTIADSLAPLLWQPVRVDETINGFPKPTKLYNYDLERARHFGGDSALAQYFGSEISTRREWVKCPWCDECDPDTTYYRYTETHFENLEFLDTIRTFVDSSKMHKFLTLQKYLYFKEHAGLGGSWEEHLYDPDIFVGGLDTVQLRVPPLFGLTVSTMTMDMKRGTVRTKYNIYQTTVPEDPWGIPRGVLLRDSIAGGVINGPQKGMLLSRRTYVNTRGHWVPDSTVNGIGSTSEQFYKYVYSNSNLSHKDSSSSPYQLSGKILDFADNVRDFPLENDEYWSYLFEQPAVSRQFVRYWDPTVGGVRTRVLDTYQELTYYGQPSGIIDPNGWYSQYEYDADGRLLTARLPYDFPVIDSMRTMQVQGIKEFDVTGISSALWTYDTLYCDANCQPSGYANMPMAQSQTVYSILYADYPANAGVDCYGEAAPSSQKEGAHVQRSCNAPLPYVRQNPAVGALYLWLEKVDTASIVSLDSAWVRLYLGAVSDTCTQLEFSKQEWNYSISYSLNCPLPPSNSNRSNGKNGPVTQTTGDGVYLDEHGREYLLLDLTAYRDQLDSAARSTEKFVTLRFEVSSPGGHVSFLSGIEGEDVRPRLVLKGTFLETYKLPDYTLQYEHDDETLQTTVLAKVDDTLHSANLIDWTAYNSNRRQTKSVHRFGADYRILSTRYWIGDPNAPMSIDSVAMTYTGDGKRRRATDQIGDTTVVRYDGLGRQLETINADGTHSTVAYYFGLPLTFGFDGQEFPCEFVAATVTTREDGAKFARYEDAFGNLRREVADSGGLTLTTTYDYDYLGQLYQVVNPAGDTTRYWYDEFGRVRYKHQPDMGYISYAYDDLGNIRFSQTQSQADSGRMTFNEYDDLNRLVLVGEMIDLQHAEADSMIHYGIAAHDGSGSSTASGSARQFVTATTAKHGATPQTDGDELGLNRLTDLANPDLLNTGEIASLLTANRTLWMQPYVPVPKVREDSTTWVSPCQLGPNILLGDTLTPMPPYLAAPVGITSFYDPRKGPGAMLYDFEHLAQYPHFPRMAICYDTLPYRQGPIWGNFPSYAAWDSIAPRGRIRNMKGHEVAVAYREHGGEPYHYVVLSFDERGRVEALLRYTENLGFDAVYYTYNSMNEVTSTRVADPFRQYTTWYGYDNNGRVDSVWTKLDDVGSGLLAILPSMRADSLKRPMSYNRYDSVSVPDITYLYNQTGQVGALFYPQANVRQEYYYNKRKRLTQTNAMTASGPFSWLFRQKLTYDSAGQITKQESRHGNAAPWLVQNYFYDAIQRLTGWKSSTSPDTVYYTYDDVGNRTYESSGGTNTLSMYTATQTPNRLQTTITTDPLLPNPARTDYSYNLNGSVTDRNYYSVTGQGLISTGEDHFSYSYRELTWRYIKGDPGTANHRDWRYRYNAMGEREQKRLYHHEMGDDQPNNARPWVYYLLGGQKEQLSVWEGQQTSQPVCNNPGRTVFMYPVEYLTYGAGSSALLTTRPSGAKEYKLVDHLGSTRAVVYTNGSLGWERDYEPFGDVMGGASETRKGYIDKERDGESEIRNHGVRQYDPALPRFLSVDPQWEKYRSVTPYQYAINNPLRVTDQDGEEIEFSDDKIKVAYMQVLEYFESHGIEEARILRDLLENKNYKIYVYSSVGIGMQPVRNLWQGNSTQTLWWHYEAAGAYINEDGRLELTSPAISLIHEATHAWLEDERPDLLDKIKGAKSEDGWGNSEEQWVTQQVEAPVAQRLGEVEKGRTAHDCNRGTQMSCGVYYKTSGPISRDIVGSQTKEKGSD